MDKEFLSVLVFIVGLAFLITFGGMYVERIFTDSYCAKYPERHSCVVDYYRKNDVNLRSSEAK